MSKFLAVTAEIAFQFWETLDCPTSLGLAIAARSGDWAAVLKHKLGPENFIDPFEFAKANAAITLLKKNPVIPGASEEERKAAALKAWEDGEALCYSTNQRLSPFLVSPLSSDAPAVFLRRVRRRLLSWLGQAPDDDELKARARHGPGTTFSSKVANPTAADKYDDTMSLTSGASWYLANIVGTKWGALAGARYVSNPDDCVQFTKGNRWTTVPKTALTHRNIAIEPSLNIYFQLAVGSALRARMRKRAGWDLDNVAGIHREMARQSSIDGRFATIDLSNASDSLCKNLVRVLLRDSSWLPILEDLRSTRTLVNGRWHVLEKFSSMGNGYTFELETCIFAAIAAECLVLRGIEPKFGQSLFVFGDDIIVPTEAAQLVVDTLQWSGFQVNKDKTFLAGPFRESCGGDYYLGVPVRGYYLKEGLSNVHHDRIFAIHNGSKVVLENAKVDPSRFLECLRARLPVALRRMGGPTRLGDTVLHGVEPKEKWKNGIRWVRAVRWAEPTIVRWRFFSEEARLACRLTGYGETFGISARGRIPVQIPVWVSDS